MNDICRCSCELQKPRYLLARGVMYQFYKPNRMKTVKIDMSEGSKDRIPTAGTLGMNPSQHAAFISALTQEFSVIQGETHILFVQHMNKWYHRDHRVKTWKRLQYSVVWNRIQKCLWESPRSKFQQDVCAVLQSLYRWLTAVYSSGSRPTS